MDPAQSACPDSTDDDSAVEHVPAASTSPTARLQRFSAAALEWARHVPGATLIVRIIAAIATSGLTDRAMTLAAQAFTSVLPIAILLTTLPVGRGFLDRAMQGFGIDTARLDIPTVDSAERFGAFGVIGALMVVASATSLSRALGRMYLSAFVVNKLTWRSWWRWVVVLVVIAVAVVVQGIVTPVHQLSITGRTWHGFGLVGVLLEVVLSLVLWWAVWTVIPRLLVSSQVPMRLLAVNGLLTSVALTIYLIGSRIVLPQAMPQTTRQYGTLGLVFVTISWLFFYTCIVVASATIVNTIVTDDGFLGRHLSAFTGLPKPLRTTTDTTGLAQLIPGDPATRPESPPSG